MLDLAMKVEWCFGVIRWDKILVSEVGSILGVRVGISFWCQRWARVGSEEWKNVLMCRLYKILKSEFGQNFGIFDRCELRLDLD